MTWRTLCFGFDEQIRYNIFDLGIGLYFVASRMELFLEA